MCSAWHFVVPSFQGGGVFRDYNWISKINWLVINDLIWVIQLCVGKGPLLLSIGSLQHRFASSINSPRMPMSALVRMLFLFKCATQSWSRLTSVP
jgi:hypothetical protein